MNRGVNKLNARAWMILVLYSIINQGDIRNEANFVFTLVVWRVPLFLGHDATFVTDRFALNINKYVAYSGAYHLHRHYSQCYFFVDNSTMLDTNKLIL